MHMFKIQSRSFKKEEARGNLWILDRPSKWNIITFSMLFEVGTNQQQCIYNVLSSTALNAQENLHAYSMLYMLLVKPRNVWNARQRQRCGCCCDAGDEPRGDERETRKMCINFLFGKRFIKDELYKYQLEDHS